MQIILQKIRPLMYALTILAVAGVGVWWLTFAVANYGDDLLNRMQTLANEKAFEEQYNALTASLTEVEQDQATLEQFLLQDDRDTIDLLSELDAIADRIGVELGTSQLEEEETNGTFNTLLITYVIEGDEDAVMRMVHIFETLPYHGDVQSMQYNRSYNEESDTIEVRTTIGLALSIRDYD